MESIQATVQGERLHFEYINGWKMRSGGIKVVDRKVEEGTVLGEALLRCRT